MAEDVELRGHVVGGIYKLVRHIEDGVPALYEAQHPRVAGRFAARLWPLTVPWDAFRRGAEVAATLRHPGIVQVVDFNCEPGAPPFVITEWASGMRLAYLLGTSGRLAMHRTAALVESTAYTLAAAHQQGVVHQELRPADIFVIEGAGSTREWTKVDGLGLEAALVRANAAAPSPYRAPEQATPDEDGADPLSDQFALAAIAYEMLTGARPFPDAAAARSTEPRPISDAAPGVPAAVDSVVRRALAADPEQRFAGILEFARALREATEGVNTQVVRRRKLEPRNAVRAQATEAIEAGPPPPPRLTPEPVWPRIQKTARGWAAAAVRLARSARLPALVPTGTSARLAIAIVVLGIGFGTTAALLRRPHGRRHAPAAVAAKAAEPHAAATPVAPPAPPPAPAPAAAAPAAADTTLASLTPGPDNAGSGGAEAPEAQEQAKAPPVAAVKVAGEAEGDPAAAEAKADAPPPEPPHKKRPPRRNPVVAAANVASALKPRPLPAATTPVAAADPGCVINIGSKPSADVWLDERNLNRRTPLVGYRVGCGDHKLVLKRDDLDLYQMEVITVRAGKPFKKAYPLQ